MSKRSRILLISGSVIMLCVSLIVGMTYALFTASVPVTNHLKAGSLDISLQRNNLEYAVLNDDGYLEVFEVSDVSDFTDESADNVFGVDAEGVKLVPGSYFDAEMEIINKGTVAFTYSIGIKLSGEANEFAEQLKVIVTHTDGSKTEKMLSELADGLTISAGEMSKNDASQKFGVRIEFINDSSVNNSAMDQTAVFDLVVEAQQATKKLIQHSAIYAFS